MSTALFKPLESRSVMGVVQYAVLGRSEVSFSGPALHQLCLFAAYYAIAAVAAITRKVPEGLLLQFAVDVPFGPREPLPGVARFGDYKGARELVGEAAPVSRARPVSPDRWGEVVAALHAFALLRAVRLIVAKARPAVGAADLDLYPAPGGQPLPGEPLPEGPGLDVPSVPWPTGLLVSPDAALSTPELEVEVVRGARAAGRFPQEGPWAVPAAPINDLVRAYHGTFFLLNTAGAGRPLEAPLSDEVRLAGNEEAARLGRGLLVTLGGGAAAAGSVLLKAWLAKGF